MLVITKLVYVCIYLKSDHLGTTLGGKYGRVRITSVVDRNLRFLMFRWKKKKEDATTTQLTCETLMPWFEEVLTNKIELSVDEYCTHLDKKCGLTARTIKGHLYDLK